VRDPSDDFTLLTYYTNGLREHYEGTPEPLLIDRAFPGRQKTSRMGPKGKPIRCITFEDFHRDRFRATDFDPRTGLTNFAVAVWAFRQTGSVTLFSITILAITVPSILVSPITGAMAPDGTSAGP
jgi:hypothetical protein